MAVVQQGKSITMTALGDAVTRRMYIRSIQFTGITLVVGERLRVLNTAGSVIADYRVEAAAVDNAELIMTPAWWGGARLEAGTLGGTWTVTIGLG